MKIAEGGGFLLAEGAQRSCALARDRRRDRGAKVGGFGAGPRGERKNMQVRERQALDKFEGAAKIFIRFAGKSGDYVRADGGIRKQCARIRLMRSA